MTKKDFERDCTRITKYVIQKNSVKNIIQIKNLNKIDKKEEQKLKLLINDFLKT